MKSLNHNLGAISLKKIPTVFWGLLLLGVFFSLASREFFTIRNIVNIFQQGSFLIILCMGVIVVKIMGGIELSVGGVMSLSGMVMAFCIVNFGFPVWAGLLLSLLVGAVCGFLNGIFVDKMNVPSFIATLGMQYIAVGIALIINNGNVIWGMPDVISKIGSSTVIGIPFTIFIALCTVILSFFILNHTVIGGYFYAIGGNEEALKLSGRRSWIYKVIGYGYCGVLAAVAGIVMTIRMQAAQPTVGVGMEFEAFSSCVLGGAIASGRGSVGGAFLGALFIVVLRNGLNNIGVSSFYQLAIIGSAIVVSIVLTLFFSRRIEGEV